LCLEFRRHRKLYRLFIGSKGKVTQCAGRHPWPLRAQTPSAAREDQPESGHFLAVASQQDAADQDRVVPGLALKRRVTSDLRKLIGGRLDQRQLALFRQHQQQVLVGQADKLALPVASALPLALAVCEINAREEAPVEAVGMA